MKEIERKSDVAAVQMEAGKTYYITVEARYWSIQKYVASEQEAIAVQAGKTYTASLEERDMLIIRLPRTGRQFIGSSLSRIR